MTLRLLAGPFDMRPYGAPDDWRGYIGIHGWIPGVGLVAGTSAGGWYRSMTGIMTLDGVYCDRSAEDLYEFGWWPARGRLLRCFQIYLYAFELTYDLIGFARQYTGPVEDQPTPSHPLVGKRFIRLSDRDIFFHSTQTHSIMGVFGEEQIPEGPPLDFADFGGNANVFPGRTDEEVWIGERGRGPFSDTRGLFYNTISRTFSSPIYHIGMGANSLVYATDFGVLISDSDAPEGGNGRRQLRIWSFEVEPTTMSPVELMENLPKAGYVVRYRVVVTGDHQDPAEGEVVNWSISGAGVLIDTQSVTDDHGVAVTRVQYGLGEFGPSIVDASLTC